MKKIWLCILAGIFLISFSACGGNDLIVDTPDQNGTSANTSENLSSDETAKPDIPENYALGTFDGKIFRSKWLGLNFQLPNGWTTIGEDDRKKFNDTAIPAYKNGSIEELYYIEIAAWEDDGKDGTKDHNSLVITSTFKSSVETLEGYVEKNKKSIEKTNADIVWDAEYILADQDYILCKSTVSGQNQQNGLTEKYRTWDLWREKDGAYVCIQCSGYEDSDILQNLSYIKKYEDPASTGNSTDTSSSNSTKNSTSSSTSSSTNSSAGGSNNYAQTNNPCANGHNWVAVTEKVHHDEVGHYESVMIKEESQWYKCPVCGETFYSLNSYYSHFDSAHSDTSFLRNDYTHGRIPADYEKKWIVDKKAYDETVTTGYRCSVCGQRK